MHRYITNTLAVIGGLTVLGSAFGFVIRQVADKSTGIVVGPDLKPLARVPAFLDRGGQAIERYLTDGAGKFTLPLAPQEIRRAMWLICAPEGIPMVGSRRDENDVWPTQYQYTKLGGNTWGFYRAWGWRGPIPRECPQARDTVSWLYFPSPNGRGVATTVEPEWPK